MIRYITTLVLLALFSVETTYALFPDNEYSWYRDSITTLVGEGVISGFADGTFGGDKTITRAEILKVFLRAK